MLLHDLTKLILQRFNFILKFLELSLLSVQFWSHRSSLIWWHLSSCIIDIIIWSVFILLINNSWRSLLWLLLITNCLWCLNYNSLSLLIIFFLPRWLLCLRKSVSQIDFQNFLLDWRFITTICLIFPELLQFEVFRTLKVCFSGLYHKLILVELSEIFEVTQLERDFDLNGSSWGYDSLDGLDNEVLWRCCLDFICNVDIRCIGDV